MRTRQLRLMRAAAASSTATVLAAVSHTVGGGMPPHPLLTAAVSVLLIVPVSLLIGTRPSRARTAGAVALSQIVFHTLFHLLGGTLASGTTGSSGHVHGAVLGPVVSTVAPDAGMLTAHLCAAALTTGLLWHGERLLRGVAAWAQARLRRAVTPITQRFEVPAPCTGAHPPLVLSPLTASVSRRGPPLR